MLTNRTTQSPTTAATATTTTTTPLKSSSSRRIKNGNLLKASPGGRSAANSRQGNEEEVKQDDDRKEVDDGFSWGLSTMSSDALMDSTPDIGRMASAKTTKRKNGDDDVDDDILGPRMTKTKMKKARKRVKKEDDDDNDDKDHVDDIEDFPLSASSLPPPHWREVYEAMKSQRAKIIAPVDTMGCERLAQEDVSPKVYTVYVLALHILALPFPPKKIKSHKYVFTLFFFQS